MLWGDRLSHSQQDASARRCHLRGSYASTSDPRLHFGLGDSTMIEALEVMASGAKENFSVPQVDRIVTLTRGRDEALTCHSASTFRWRDLTI